VLSADGWSVEGRLGIVLLYGKSQITKILEGAVLVSGVVSQGQWLATF
jgi:hypothetical protein